MADCHRTPTFLRLYEVVRVLVVEDEPNIVDVLCVALRFNGFDVEVAGSGSAALDAVRATRPDLMLLDVMLPDLDGFAVCRTLRAEGVTVPIVFLTARDGRSDTVAGLTYGGDDYVTKPFSIDELLARVRAVLRRTAAATAQPPGPSVLRIADLEVREDDMTVRRGGQEIVLSPTEYRLLAYFLRHPGRVLSREQILAAVWPADFTGELTVVDTFVSYLRRKIDVAGPPLIHTQRGFGYLVREPTRT
jgi:two-component system, OmpR family, response regulator